MWDKKYIISPMSFKAVFDTKMDNFFAGSQQHDSHEALYCILENINNEIRKKQDIIYNSPNEKITELLQKTECHFLNFVMDEMGKIPYLPIHDALIVKKSDAERTKEIFNSMIAKHNIGNILRIK